MAREMLDLDLGTQLALLIGAVLAGLFLGRFFENRTSRREGVARRRLERSEVFKQLAMEASVTTDLKETIQNILRKARRLVRCEASTLFLVDKEHGELYSLALSGAENSPFTIPRDKGIAGRVATTGKPLNVNDAYQCVYFNPEVDTKTGFKTTSVLCVPIFSNEAPEALGKRVSFAFSADAGHREVIGVVQLLNKLDASGGRGSFSDDDLHDLQELTLLASVYLWNSSVTKFNRWAENESSQLLRSITRQSFRSRSPSAGDSSRWRTSSLRAVSPQTAAHASQSPPFTPRELSPAEVAALRNITDFDVLKFYKEPARCDDLILFLVQMWEDLGFTKTFGFTPAKIRQLGVELRSVYRNVPYHNFAHAIDVTHSIYGFLLKPDLANLFDPVERLTLFMAAMFHDADHHGLNNQFHLRSNHPSSILLETTATEMQSVLEIHHCNVAIEVLTDPRVSFLEVLSEDQRRKVWREMISCILATDMNEHESLVQDARQLKDGPASNKLLAMQLLLKLADINGLSKPTPCAEKWGMLLQEEFYVQGDKERELGLKVTPMFDRSVTIKKLAGSLGFLRNVALPYYCLVADIFPCLHFLPDQARVNEKAWAAS
ncbi:putative 3prime [Diplonema papillatum]|nr:putative 3prime [Diplonema papillatum]